MQLVSNSVRNTLRPFILNIEYDAYGVYAGIMLRRSYLYVMTI